MTSDTHMNQKLAKSIAVHTEHRPYQPKTGEKCHCRRGIQRDNCPDCEGTGWRINFRAIRERSKGGGQ